MVCAKRLCAMRYVLLVAFSILVARGALVSGQEVAGETSAKEVEFPSVWVNSDPISAESLRGKAVFLYFFEETCPSCRARWPSIMEKARAYEKEPILFVAVNSGSTKQD